MPGPYQTYFAGQNRVGDIVGEGLADAFAMYAQGKRQKKLDTEAHDKEQREQAWQNVLRELTMQDQGVVRNEDANPGAMMPGSGSRRDVAMPQVQPNPMPDGSPMLQATPRSMAPTPGAFDPASGTFAPLVPRFQKLGNTGYSRDMQNTPEAKRLAQAMAEREQSLADEQRHRSQGIEDYGEKKRIDVQYATPKTPPADTWTTRETNKGLIQINDRTGETRPLGYEGYHPPRENLPGLTPAQANEVKKQQTALLNLQRSLGALKAHVQQNGVAYWPGTEERSKLEPLVRDAMIQFKEAANLGAITGPDMELIEGMIGNPASMSQIFRGRKGGALASFDQVEQSLLRRAQTLKDVYGVDMPESFSTGGAAVAAQRAEYDQAAAALKAQGRSQAQIMETLGGRP